MSGQDCNMTDETLENQYYCCSICWTPINPTESVVYYCKQCPDYFVCGGCQPIAHHVPGRHRILKMGYTFIATSDCEDSDSYDEESEARALLPKNPIVKDKIPHCYSGLTPEKRENLDKCLGVLFHTLECEPSRRCADISCKKMKLVLEHIRTCRRKVVKLPVIDLSSACGICKQLVSLCAYHAVSCEKMECDIPYCVNIREKMIKKHDLEQAKKRSDELKAVMSGQKGVTATTSSIESATSTPTPTHSKSIELFEEMNNDKEMIVA